MPLAFLRRIPLGCYAGALLIVLGAASLDIRGVYLGVILIGVTTLSFWYRRRNVTRSW